MKLTGVSVMANANHIADAVRSVSLHLEAINLLGDVLAGVRDESGTKVYQYDFCLAFKLLAEAAQEKLGPVEEGVVSLAAFKADMNILSRAAG
jgi:hypothetical protein